MNFMLKKNDTKEKLKFVELNKRTLEIINKSVYVQKILIYFKIKSRDTCKIKWYDGFSRFKAIRKYLTAKKHFIIGLK